MMTTHERDAYQFSIDLPITIRTANKEDIKRLEWRGQYRHFRRVFYRAFMQQRSGLRILFVAVYNDYPIGRLFLLLNSQNQIIANGTDRGYLYSFRVMDVFQGLGIGTRLVSHAEEALRQRQYTLATIAVAKTNKRALELYHRLGYEIFTEDKGEWHYYDHQGQRQDIKEPCWLLEKTLQ